MPRWVFSGSILALWAFRGRPWATLMLEPITPLRLGFTFALVALTAGTCEDFLFRGYVTWCFLGFWPGGRIGLVFAVIISAILFGFAHIYLGVRQVGG